LSAGAWGPASLCTRSAKCRDCSSMNLLLIKANDCKGVVELVRCVQLITISG